jgi:hypothetical protein
MWRTIRPPHPNHCSGERTRGEDRRIVAGNQAPIYSFARAEKWFRRPARWPDEFPLLTTARVARVRRSEHHRLGHCARHRLAVSLATAHRPRRRPLPASARPLHSEQTAEHPVATLAEHARHLSDLPQKGASAELARWGSWAALAETPRQR